MTIDRDDRDERQLRVDGMIREFQDARRRRLVTVSERPVPRDPGTGAAGCAAAARASRQGDL